jgi:serine/threonine-protein kinase
MSDTIHDRDDVVAGRYKVLEYVGEGGMQEVYRAKDELLAREVALRTPKNSSAKKRFERSAIMSARINHANVAKTMDYMETSKRPYLIEEFVTGRDLADIMASFYTALDPYLVAGAFHRLAKGLAASHHAKVVHRDLKPSNVMIVGGEDFVELKITDFGIAKMAEQEIDEAAKGGAESLTASKTALGAIPYMAPEAIKASGEAGHPSDVWSAGAMVYELISGKKPFGMGYMAIPEILKADPPSMPRILTAKAQFRLLGEQIFEIILRCLAKDPSDRPTADSLVKVCEQLCYSLAPREFGRVRSYGSANWGFIAPLSGKDVFFHNDSIYGEQRFDIGDLVWFARHVGGGADRAFPLIKVKPGE